MPIARATAVTAPAAMTTRSTGVRSQTRTKQPDRERERRGPGDGAASGRSFLLRRRRSEGDMGLLILVGHGAEGATIPGMRIAGRPEVVG